MPDNADSWEMYCLVRDQIRQGGMGDILSLDNGAVLATLALYEIEDPKRIFEDIMIMFNAEQEAVKSNRVKVEEIQTKKKQENRT